MVLLYPAATGVFRTEEHQHRRFKLRHVVLVKRFTRETTRQNAVQLGFAGVRKQHHVQRMVRDFTAMCRKVIQTFGQRGLQIGETADIGIGHLCQLRHVIVEGGLFDVESFVRAPAWQHFNIERGIFRHDSVMFQGVNGIVGGTHHLHVHLLHDTACGEVILRQQFVALVPDFIRSGR